MFFCSREHQGLAFKLDSGINIFSGPKSDRRSKLLRAEKNCLDCKVARHEENLKNGRCFYCNRTFTELTAWLGGDLEVTYSGRVKDPKAFVKAYLVETRGDKCQNCGFDIKKKDGSSIIQMNHIDGNYLNNKIENLELLCPNCHGLTDNWGSKNIEIGRRRMARILKENILPTID